MRHVWMGLALAACDGGPTLGDLAPAEAWEGAAKTAPTVRRLTDEVYAHAMTDLLGEVVLPPGAKAVTSVGGLHEVGAATAGYSPREIESLFEGALDAGEQAVANDAWRKDVLGCAGEVNEACLTSGLRRMARKAWRRSIDEDEAKAWAKTALDAIDVTGSRDEGVAYGIAAVLASPEFLYRADVDTRAKALSDHALASRLAHFLWASVPDDALMDAADDGTLATDEGLFGETLRMLDDPRARRGVQGFFSDMFELGDLDGLLKDPTIFEHANPELGVAAREETLRLLSHVALDADTDFRDVLTTRDTFLDARLATLYGVPAPVEPWALVTFPEAVPRMGVLSHASFLAGHAHAVSSSATLRGKFVRTKLLCDEILPPPVDVDTSIPEASGTTPTLRDRVAEHLTSPSCKGCHELMDPIGLAFETYDGIGRHRTQDNGVTIDASGDLDGTPFDDALALAKVVRDEPKFPACVAQTLTRYARGQVEDDAEDAWLDVLTERFETHDYRVRMLIVELVMSPLFRQAQEVTP